MFPTGLLWLSLGSFLFVPGYSKYPNQATVDGHFNPDFQLSHSYDYCHPDTPDSATYEPVPGASLSHVQIVIRHGDRAPIVKSPRDRSVWDCGPRRELRYYSGGNEFDPYRNTTGERSNLGPLSDTPKLEHVTYSPPTSPFRDFVFAGTCEPGELTELGQAQHRFLGRQLRAIYVDKLGLLPVRLEERSSAAPPRSDSPYHANGDVPIFIRSTTLWRTRVSAQSLIDGLYPADRRAPGVHLRHIVYPLEAETMIGQAIQCPTYSALLNTMRASPVYQEYLDSRRDIQTLYDKLLGTAGLKEFKDKFTSNVDVAMSRFCHQSTRPDYVDYDSDDPAALLLTDWVTNDLARRTITLGSWEYVYFRRDHSLADQYSRLGLGWFIQELAARWDLFRDADIRASHATVDQTPLMPNPPVTVTKEPVLELYSGHDETLAFLSAILGQHDMAWPSYASQIIIEFWTPHDRSEEMLVRVLYNGRIVQSNKCDFSRCPYSQFRRLMALYIPRSYDECLVPDPSHP
ncbi:hypothetical protein IWQ60_003582 [Tieghemiomyces parasiticus]|uniref:Acid phosphatase n=1 Tax=Tieghemiomyces parasiticus TaxID=78921 RepID=A0A9W8AHM9_9FUNG|nr:hypothetical protein IWQ60_003582 [Tieghemiomyces parasiticus]